MAYPLSFITKGGVVLGLRIVLYLEGELVYDFFLLWGVFIPFEGCSEVYVYFSFLSLYISLLYTGLVTIYLRHILYFLFLYI